MPHKYLLVFHVGFLEGVDIVIDKVDHSVRLKAAIV